MWTKNQQKAINTKCPVIISASAGTGKTAVMTEKVVQTVLKGVELKNILVLTFSENAASEMKERINQKLLNLTEQEGTPSETKDFLYCQLSKFSSDAQITTFHSFLYQIIRKYGNNLRDELETFSPDPDKANILQAQATKEVFEGLAEDELAYEVFRYLGNKQEKEQFFNSLYNKVRARPDWQKWMDTKIEEIYNNPKIPQCIISYLHEVYQDSQFELSSIYSNLPAFLDDEKQDNALQKTKNIIEENIQNLSSVLNCLKNSTEVSGKELSSFNLSVRFPKGYDELKTRYQKVKEKLKPFRQEDFLLEKETEKNRGSYLSAKKIFGILTKIDARYQQLKIDNKIIDFDDMESFAQEILKNEHVAFGIKSQYSLVFVDEYQDTSEMQESILQKITSDNLFCVGDIKQSIYGFRNACPRLFSERLKTTPVIHLSDNFRSSQSILDFTNDVFSFIGKNSDLIHYEADEVLVHGRADNGEAAPISISLLNEDSEGEMSKPEIEVCRVVQTIEAQLGKPIWDNEISDVRPTRYNDFAILCRSLAGKVDTFTQLFNANNIPFSIEQTGNVMDTIEVKIFIALVSLLVKRDDLGVLAVMHEGLFSFCDEDIKELEQIAAQNKISISKAFFDKSLFSGSLKKKIRNFMGFQTTVKKQEKVNPIKDVLMFIAQESGYLDYCAVSYYNRQAYNNVMSVIKKGEGQNSLFSFLRLMKQIKTANIRIPSENEIPEDSVTITTIHKSKGLEYPIVILPFMSTQFSQLDLQESVLYSDDGIALDSFSFETRKKAKTLLRDGFSANIKKKEKEEEIRLLYVALTRPTEKLFLQGFNNPKANLIEADSYFDFILASANNLSKAPVQTENVYKEELAPFKVQYNPVSKEDFMRAIPNFEVNKNVSDNIVVPYSAAATCAATRELFPHKPILSAPYFMESKNSAAAKGTTVHSLLQRLPAVNENCSVEYLKQKIGELSGELPIRFPYEGVSEFFNSELGLNFVKANKVFREKSISYFAPANSLFDVSSDKMICIHCILDVLFIYNDTFYIVDYKTDKEDKTAQAKYEKYKQQLSIYQKAVAQYFDVPENKVQKYLIFLNHKDVVTQV